MATFDDFRSWSPCCLDEQIDVYAEQCGLESWTALDVLDPEILPDVSNDDRAWVVLRPQMLPSKVWSDVLDWICRCAVEARAVDRRGSHVARLASRAASYATSHAVSDAGLAAVEAYAAACYARDCAVYAAADLTLEASAYVDATYGAKAKFWRDLCDQISWLLQSYLLVSQGAEPGVACD